MLAARHERLVATAWVATDLTDAQQRSRLAESLARPYSHEVHLNVVVDPDRARWCPGPSADDVIDSTIETRLAEAQRRLVG